MTEAIADSKAKIEEPPIPTVLVMANEFGRAQQYVDSYALKSMLAVVYLTKTAALDALATNRNIHTVCLFGMVFNRSDAIEFLANDISRLEVRRRKASR